MEMIKMQGKWRLYIIGLCAICVIGLCTIYMDIQATCKIGHCAIGIIGLCAIQLHLSRSCYLYEESVT